MNQKSSVIESSKIEFLESNFDKSNPRTDPVMPSPAKSDTNEIVKKILE